MAATPSSDLEWASIGPGAGVAAPPLASPVAAGATPPLVGGRAPVDETFTIISLITPSFYSACFDVDAADIFARISAALWPFRPPQPFLALIAAKPDLYGPIWLAATLVFIIGAGSNLASWLNFSSSTAISIWQYDFKALTKALVFVYGFSFLAPVAVWSAMAYMLPRNAGLGIVSLTCVYGYSVSPFIPAALVCVLPSSILQWLAVLSATVISAAFTLQSTYRSALIAMDTAALATGPSSQATLAVTRRGAHSVLVFIIAAQVTFGVLLKLYFFSFSAPLKV